ncbi:phage tail length tape measure family protein, partial [Gemmobacter nanjingensis]|uniref:phage tail length tape measure family protein n=1 Tax=Gemmobacter nanjingensis TaxID=488454 RepID=UPI00167C1919
MSGKQFVFSLLFKGENAGAKAAAREVEQGLDAVQGQARQTTVALKGNAETLEQEARASRKAADAARELALAEKRVRDEAARSQGAQSPAITLDPKRVEELRERYVPMAKIQKDYAKELDQIALAERAGALTATESAMVRARLRSVHEAEISSLQRSTAALDANNKATKLSAHERRILNMQLSDTAQSLALGMPPLQVLLQQGPQITDLFGGVGDTLQAVAQAATPARLAIGGIVTTALIGVTAWNGYLKSVKEVDTAAAGLGRGMAGTRQEMEAAAQAGAEAAGISVKAARSMEAAFLRTGRIDSSNFAGLIGLSDNFAATIGADAQAAGAALSEIFADPAKGADVLYRQYGLISGATAQLAKDLSAQNRQAEAQAVLIKALPASLANAEEATTALGRAWAYVAQKAGNAGDAIGGAIDRAISGPSLDERIAEVRSRIDSMQGRDWSAGIFGNRTGGVYAGAYQEDLDLLADLTREKRSRDEAAARQRQQAAANRLTAPALALAEASPATQSSRQQRDLSNQIAALRAGRDADGLSAEQRDDITRAIEAKSRALDGLANRQTYQNTLDQIGIQLASERNPLRQAELVLMQTFLASAGKEITWAEASAEAMRARNRVMGEAMGAAKAQSADMRVELEIRARLNTQVAAGLITAEEANRL